MKSFVYSILKLIARSIFWWPLNFPAFRRIVFDSAQNGTFIYTGFEKDNYLLSAGDKVISREIYMNGGYDIGKLELAVSLLQKTMQPPRTLIDIGANVGCICIPAVTSGKFDSAIAIEPDPRNYNLLLANIAINDLVRKITPHNLALSDATGELHLELSHDNFGDHRVRKSSEPSALNDAKRKIIPVSATTFDNLLFPEMIEDALIWMDTQGHEGIILSRATKSLSPKLPIVLEFWPFGMQHNGGYPLLKQALFSAGYTHFYELVGKSPECHVLNEPNLDELYNRFVGVSGRFSDILVI